MKINNLEVACNNKTLKEETVKDKAKPYETKISDIN